MKRLGTWLLGLALVLLAAIGGLYWYAGSEQALRWAAERAVRESGGKLTLEGMSGSLLGELRIAHAVWRDKSITAEARDTRLVWSPAMLTDRRVLLNQLTIARLDVTLASSDGKPPVLPQSLALPVPVQVVQVDVAALNVNSGGTLVAITGLRLAYRGDAGAHELELARLSSPFGSLEGNLRMDAAAPFGLAGKLNAATTVQGVSRTEVILGGDLKSLRATGRVQLTEGQLNLNARLAPFELAPLKQLSASGEGINLAQFNATLPATALQFELTGEGRDGGLAGEFKLDNAKAGTLDTARLPVKQASGRYAGDVKLLKLTELQLDLGAAGQFTGAADVAVAGTTMDLQTRNFNLRGLQSTLRPTALAGRIQARAEGQKQTVLVDLAQGKLRIMLDALHAGDVLTINKAELRSGGALLTAQGEVNLTGNKPFTGSGKLASFNPAAFGDFPQAAINSTMTLKGQLSPAWRAAVDLRVTDSRLRGQPLVAQARFNATAQRISEVDLRADIGGNRVNARGALGRPGDTLALNIDAPHLAAAAPQWSGSVRAEGNLRGSFTRPAVALKIDARDLKGPQERRLAELTGHIDIGDAGDRSLALDLRARGIAASGVTLDAAALTVSGSIARHTIAANAQQGGRIDFSSRADGGWDEKAGWRGTLASLENRGNYPVKLKVPVPVTIARDHLSLIAAELQLSPGSLRLDELVWQGGVLNSRGSMAGVPASWVLSQVGNGQLFESTLTLGGKWSVRMDEYVNATLDLQREGGDLTIVSSVPGEPRLRLGLSSLALKGAVVQDKVTADLNLTSSGLGDAKASVATQLSRRNGNWGLGGDAPLRVNVHAGIRSIAPLMPLVSADVAAEGRLQVEIIGEGTVATPKLKGTLAGDELRIESPAYGLFWRKGSLRATFDERNLQLSELLFFAGPGKLTASGSARLGGGEAQSSVQWKAEQFAVLARPDVRLTITGSGSLSLEKQRLQVRGSARADVGAIELLSSIARLGDDVMVVRRSAKPAAAPPVARAPEKRIVTDIDVSFDLGDKFTVVGKGLEATVAGAIKIKGGAANLNAEGAIRVTRGEYLAYGRRLQIERGTLFFAGPVDNPGLNIRAMRKNQLVEAGVEVTGTAKTPIVTLVSNPEVTENEKISWLVLGHGPDTTKGGDVTLLQAAQAAVGAVVADKSGADSLTRQLTKATGLDEIRLKGGAEVGSQTLELGARLSERVYVTYEQGLSAASRALRLNFMLTPRWTLRAENGTTSAVDLFYTFSFD